MSDKTFVSLQELAQHTGLPMAWLRIEAQNEHIPSIRAGRRLMFNPDDVERTLEAAAGRVPSIKVAGARLYSIAALQEWLSAQTNGEQR